MRGLDEMQESLFTVAKLEDFVPADHPLRPIRKLLRRRVRTTRRKVVAATRKRTGRARSAATTRMCRRPTRTRHRDYAVSQTIRARIEEHFGWSKTVGHLRQTMYRGIRRVDQHFKLTMTASNLCRMARILFAGPQGVAP